MGVVRSWVGNAHSFPAWANWRDPRKSLPQGQSRNQLRGCVARVRCPLARLLSSAVMRLAKCPLVNARFRDPVRPPAWWLSSRSKPGAGSHGWVRSTLPARWERRLSLEPMGPSAEESGEPSGFPPGVLPVIYRGEGVLKSERSRREIVTARQSRGQSAEAIQKDRSGLSPYSASSA